MGPKVTAAPVDATAARSTSWYGLILVVSRARCLQAGVQATTLKFVWSAGAPFALRRPLCCTALVASSGGPCRSVS